MQNQVPTHGPRLERTEMPAEEQKEILRLAKVSKYYGDRIVLDQVSFGLERGEVVALCGRSGAGKSTLLRIISGLSPFDRGSVTIDDNIIQASISYPKQLFGHIGVIFQDSNLFPHMTAFDNVALGLRKAKRLPTSLARERSMAELERMGVDTLADRYPATLSGGERQLVAIARALALDPLVLLLDEPTANLDPGRVEEVCERIVALASDGTTMVVVTHALDFARRTADRYAVLQDGCCEYSDDPTILDQLRGSQE